MVAEESTTPAGLIEESEETEGDRPWSVILYNDEVHTIDEVIVQVQKATGADLKTAFEITLQAHTMGRAVCYQGARPDCERVAGILRQIELQVEVQPSLH